MEQSKEHTGEKKFVLIGLTGNIGSGKSTASRLLSELGAGCVDADQASHTILEQGKPAYYQVLSEFGPEYADEQGNLRRRELGALVFGDKSGRLLRRLTDITHPAIHHQILTDIAMLRQSGKPAVVVEAIGLLDSVIAEMADEIWVVTAPREILLQRVMARDNCDAATAEGRLDSQLTVEQMLQRATRVFVNDGSEEKLREQLKTAFLAVIGA